MRAGPLRYRRIIIRLSLIRHGLTVATILSFIFICQADRARASAFNQPAGDGIAILSGLTDAGSRSFDTKGKLIETPTYSKDEGSLYIEYGVTDWLQAVIKPTLVSARLGGTNGGRYTGIGTSSIGAQVQALVFGPAVLAVQGTFMLPANSTRSNPALIGNTSRDAEARVLGGLLFPLGRWPSFLDVEAAYRVRGAHAPDEVHGDVTLGTRPLPNVLILLQSFTTVPVEAGVPYFPRSTYSKVELSVVYDLTLRWSVQVGAFQTVYGRNALNERGLQAAIWYRF